MQIHEESHAADSGKTLTLAVTPDTTSAGGPVLLKRKDLAQALNASLRSVDNLQAAGMPCIYIGRSRRFVFSEVLAWLKRRGGRS